MELILVCFRRHTDFSFLDTSTQMEALDFLRIRSGARFAIFSNYQSHYQMPLYIKHRLLFIHIPKCGGDTITYKLSSMGDPPLFFVADGSVLVNGHTPQHTTWKEFLNMGFTVKSGFRIAALVRHPVERVLSEFRYIHIRRPDLKNYVANIEIFLDAFLCDDPLNLMLFDSHNLGLLKFLENQSGEIEQSIHIRPIQEMNQLLDDFNLPSIRADERRNVTAHMGQFSGFKPSDIQRIYNYYQRDIEWFENTFPRYKTPFLNHL